MNLANLKRRIGRLEEDGSSPDAAEVQVVLTPEQREAHADAIIAEIERVSDQTGQPADEILEAALAHVRRGGRVDWASLNFLRKPAGRGSPG